LSVEEILRGEFLAVKRRFGWPFVVVLAFDFIWMVSALRQNGIEGGTIIVTAGCMVLILE